jgi:PAS domain S-box-containing protein
VKEAAASILIVDDRPANLLALEGILEPLGHSVVQASSGEEALKRILLNEFAVILMDVQMPGLDGFQTAAMIKERERSRHIPIIFLTAINKDAEFVFKGYAHGAVDYLLKPFDPAVLRSKVSVFVELYLRGERLKHKEALLREAQREMLERRSEERYRGLVDAMPHVVWALKPDGEVHYGNRGSAQYPGVTSRRALIGLVHPEDREEVQAKLDVAFGNGAPFEVEYRLKRADGVYRWHLARGVPERDERGNPSGWIVTSTDVHEQRLAQDEATNANRTKDEFLATVSHELRNPLNAILGWMRMLRSGRLDDEKRERALETIQRNTEAQLELVEDILDVSRIITGKLRIDVRPVRLSEVIREAVESVRPGAECKSITVETRLDPDADNVSGDPERLQQVVWNLLSNAIKFTPKGGRVEVQLERRDSHVQLRVTDSGKGIEPQFLPYVFDRFRQAEAISTRTHGGLGLGLAIVRHLVESHGGSVHVDSPGDGRGTTFLVELPIRAVMGRGAVPEEVAAAHTRPTAVALDDAPALDGLKVLVVDDEPDARELLALVLGEYGAEVTAVASAEEAMREIERLPLDVMVSDVGLPHEDGYALIRRVRALAGARAQLPAAALTGFARAEDGQRALQAGFQVHVPKPVEPARLISLVARLAGRARHRAASA